MGARGLRPLHLWRRRRRRRSRGLLVVQQDVVHLPHALIADEHLRPSNQLLHLVLVLAAKRAMEVGVGHAMSIGRAGGPLN